MKFASISLVLAAALSTANGQLATRGGKRGRHIRTAPEMDRYLAADSLSMSMAGIGGSAKGSSSSKSGKSAKAIVADPPPLVISVPFCSGIGKSCSSGDILQGVSSTEILYPDDTLDGCADGGLGIYEVDESVEQITVTASKGGELKAGEKAKIEAVVHAWLGNEDQPNGWQNDVAEFWYSAYTNTQAPIWTYIGNKYATGPGFQTLEIEFTLPETALLAVRVQFGYDLTGDGAFGPCAEETAPNGYDDTDDIALIAAGGSARLDVIDTPPADPIAETIGARKPKP